MTHEVDVDTLDRVSQREQIGQIDLLKVDVEGHELAVLQGARELLDRDANNAVQFEFGSRNLMSRSYLRDQLRRDKTNVVTGSSSERP